MLTKSNYEVFTRSVNDALNKTVFTTDQKIIPEYYYHYDNMKIDPVHTQFFINKLLLVIPEKSCNSCYDEVYDFLHWSMDLLNINIMILTSQKSYRGAVNILTDYNYSLKNLYYTKTDQIFTGGENIEFAPYLVLIDQNKIGRHLFIPLVNHSCLTKSYLINMNQRYKDVLIEIEE